VKSWHEVIAMAGNAALIRKWFDEVWNKGLEATIDAMCSKNAIGHGQGQHGADVHGPEHFKEFWRGFRAAFSNIRVEIHDTIEQGDLVVVRWTIAMTHTGTFLGIAPANKHVSVNGMSIQRFTDDQIQEAWDNWDQLSLLVQLGAVPEAKFL
jgi:steroid delta-isomerase-like uncharacterized protein